MKTVLVMILAVLGLAALVSMGGCAQYGVVKTAVAVNGAKAADEARQTAEWTLCDAMSVGAWRRAYAGDPAKADGWKKLCAQPDGAPT
jgi:hypothetical protein